MSKYLEESLKSGVPIENIALLNVTSYLELYEKLKLEKNTNPVSTGLNGLDEIMGGFENGRLYVLSAPTKQGKSTMAQTIMFSMAKQGDASVMFSYEMGWQEVTRKFMAMDKSIGITGKPSNLPLYLPLDMERVGGELQYAWLAESIAKAKIEKNIKLVVIDHLHFLLPLKDYKNTSFIIGGIVREIKRIAVSLDIPIILIAHVAKIKDDKVPDWTDIRDSSFITQEADVVLMMYRVKSKEAAKKVTEDSNLEVYTQKAFLSVELDRVRGKSGKIKLWHNGVMFEQFTQEHDFAETVNKMNQEKLNPKKYV